MQELPHADIAPTYARMQKTSLGPLLLTPPFTEGSNPGPFATFRTTNHSATRDAITAQLFLVLYRSTSLQSLSFLKNIEAILCK